MINRRNFFGSVGVAAVAVGSKAVLGKEITEEPKIILDITPRNAHYYANIIKNGPCPEFEEIIAQDAKWAYLYAYDILKGPFLLGEAIISRNAHYSYCYAKSILHKRFLPGEEAISKDGNYAFWYAKEVLEGPFPLGEAAITQNQILSSHYKSFLYGIKELKSH